MTRWTSASWRMTTTGASCTTGRRTPCAPARWSTSAARPGQHEGLPAYTIGRRKGLGIGGAGEPLYVIQLDRARDALVVGTKDELGATA